MELKDIIHTVYPSHILCTYVCDDGSVLKEKYIGYSLSEAKKIFLAKYKDLA